jgi:DNA invertase Pin-like site-specific DNA recombinase
VSDPGRVKHSAYRAGDTLVVTKLDRLARSLPDARDIADELTARQVKLSPGGSVRDPTDPVGWLLFNMLAMIAEFESDLIRMHTREGMAVARAAGKLRGRQPKLNAAQEAHLARLYETGEKIPASLASSSGSLAPRSTGQSNGTAKRLPLRTSRQRRNSYQPGWRSGVGTTVIRASA